MKAVARRKKTEEDGMLLRDDPRVRDPVIWNRMKVAIENEVVDRTWGCPLYILHRVGWITSEQRQAGDEYQRIVYAHNRCQEIDPDVFDDEFTLKRIERSKARWSEAIKVMGKGRWIIDALVLEELTLGSEKEKYIARDALQLLANFFGFGRNKRGTC